MVAVFILGGIAIAILALIVGGGNFEKGFFRLLPWSAVVGFFVGLGVGQMAGMGGGGSFFSGIVGAGSLFFVVAILASSEVEDRQKVERVNAYYYTQVRRKKELQDMEEELQDLRDRIDELEQDDQDDQDDWYEPDEQDDWYESDDRYDRE